MFAMPPLSSLFPRQTNKYRANCSNHGLHDFKKHWCSVLDTEVSATYVGTTLLWLSSRGRTAAPPPRRPALLIRGIICPAVIDVLADSNIDVA